MLCVLFRLDLHEVFRQVCQSRVALEYLLGHVLTLPQPVAAVSSRTQEFTPAA